MLINKECYFFVVKKITKIIGNIFISKNYEIYKYNFLIYTDVILYVFRLFHVKWRRNTVFEVGILKYISRNPVRCHVYLFFVHRIKSSL